MHAKFCMFCLKNVHTYISIKTLEISHETCYRLNMSSDLISLHIGDRILEVNGTPVKDQPIENIENLIQYSDTVLQVILYIIVTYIIYIIFINNIHIYIVYNMCIYNIEILINII